MEAEKIIDSLLNIKMICIEYYQLSGCDSKCPFNIDSDCRIKREEPIYWSIAEPPKDTWKAFEQDEECK